MERACNNEHGQFIVQFSWMQQSCPEFVHLEDSLACSPAAADPGDPNRGP